MLYAASVVNANAKARLDVWVDKTVIKVGTNLSIAELPVFVLAKQSNPDGGKGLGLEEPQTLLKGVVYVDPSTSANNHGAASSALRQPWYLSSVAILLTLPPAAGRSRQW
jgi:hypothetical protein